MPEHLSLHLDLDPSIVELRGEPLAIVVTEEVHVDVVDVLLGDPCGEASLRADTREPEAGAVTPELDLPGLGD